MGNTLKKLIALMACMAIGASAAESNNKEATMMKSIQLDTQIGKIAANIYLPEGIEKPPVVVVTGAWTTVKEQMPATYAEALAKQGYAAVTFDFIGWGQSADNQVFLEDPVRKTQDIVHVVNAIAQLPMVNGQSIAGLGICASSGYMLDAAVENNKLSSVAVVGPWLHDQALATSVYGGEASVEQLMRMASDAKKSQTPVLIEAASMTNQGSLMYQAPYYTETDRGLIPEYDNQFNVASWTPWLTYNAQQSANVIEAPVLMVASEAMALPAGTHQYLDKAGHNVKATWLDGISQFDFYDKPDAVNQAVELVSVHFANTL